MNMRKMKKRFHYSIHRSMKISSLVSMFLIGSSLTLVYLLSSQYSRHELTPTKTSSLYHYWRSRDLHTYIDLMETLMEPTSRSCAEPLVALVSSAPSRRRQREAIRNSWALHIPTFFFIGLESAFEEQLVDNYVESKQYRDIIVFNFIDAYTNLTLKTALMLRWSLRRCARAQFVLKTDDDVMINPWTLRQLVKKHQYEKLVGYRMTDVSPHRESYNKWYLPRWLYPRDDIPEYLVGTAYLINVAYLSNICDAAFSVPLINLEDIYFTLLVAKQKLGYKLTHDRRLSPAQPMFPFACTYWHYASVHSLGPADITRVWSKIQPLGRDYENGNTICSFYEQYFSVFSSDALSYRPLII